MRGGRLKFRIIQELEMVDAPKGAISYNRTLELPNGQVVKESVAINMDIPPDMARFLMAIIQSADAAVEAMRETGNWCVRPSENEHN